LLENFIDDIINRTNVEIVKCGDKFLNYPGKNESVLLEIMKLYCIKDKSWLKIGGSFATNRLESMELLVQPCMNTSQSSAICAPQSEIDEFLFKV